MLIDQYKATCELYKYIKDNIDVKIRSIIPGLYGLHVIDAERKELVISHCHELLTLTEAQRLLLFKMGFAGVLLLCC